MNILLDHSTQRHSFMFTKGWPTRPKFPRCPFHLGKMSTAPLQAGQSPFAVPMVEASVPIPWGLGPVSVGKKGTSHSAGHAAGDQRGVQDHTSTQPRKHLLGHCVWGVMLKAWGVRGARIPLSPGFPSHSDTRGTPTLLRDTHPPSWDLLLPVWRWIQRGPRGAQALQQRGRCKYLHRVGVFKQLLLGSSVIITQRNQLFFCYLWSPP